MFYCVFQLLCHDFDALFVEVDVNRCPHDGIFILVYFILIYFILFRLISLQTWHQSMRGIDSPVGIHLVVWSSVSITQGFYLHFCHP